MRLTLLSHINNSSQIRLLIIMDGYMCKNFQKWKIRFGSKSSDVGIIWDRINHKSIQRIVTITVRISLPPLLFISMWAQSDRLST